MNLGTGNRRQTIMAGVLGVLALGACIYIYEELFGGASTPAAAPAAPVVVTVPASVAPGPAVAAGPAAKTVGTTSAALDPTLHMEAMLVSESLEYSGNGRNIFSANSVPMNVSIPIPAAKARPQQVAVVVPPPVKICPPDCPPPPPIPLNFFGTAVSSNGTRKAFLMHEDTVYLASAGDIVMRRYRVITIDAKTIQVEDMQTNNKQTLPLLTN